MHIPEGGSPYEQSSKPPTGSGGLRLGAEVFSFNTRSRHLHGAAVRGGLSRIHFVIYVFFGGQGIFYLFICSIALLCSRCAVR